MTGVESSNVTDIAFWIAAVVAIGAALAVVTLRDVFKAALALALSFAAISGVYVLLRAEFLAVVQIMIYVGAISILIVFAIMLVRNVPGGSTDNRMFVLTGTVSALVLAAVVFTAFRTDWSSLDDQTAVTAEPLGTETRAQVLNAALVGRYIESGDDREALVPQPGVAGAGGLVNSNGEKIALDPAQRSEQPGIFADTTGMIGSLLIREFVLPFEAVSVVLLAALIGALALVRERSAS